MNYYLIVTFLLVFPVVLIGALIYFKDKDKEPIKLLVKLAFAGVLATILTLILTYLAVSVFPVLNFDYSKHSGSNLFALVFLKIGLIEEFSKIVFVYFIAWRHKEFNQSFDAIVYSVFVALGFAAFENVLYVLFSENPIKVGILRALTSIPVHAICGIFMGYFISRAKEARIKRMNKRFYPLIILALLVPSLIHSVYDTILLGGVSILIFILFNLFLDIFAFKLMVKEAKKNIYFII